MLSIGRRELKKRELEELIDIMKQLHKWNEKYNKDKADKYIDICHIEENWMVHASSSTGANYFDYDFDDVELEEEV